MYLKLFHKEEHRRTIVLTSALTVTIFVSGVVIGYRISEIRRNELLNEYKEHNLDLSEKYIGAKPLALRYFYSLKQGILREAVAELKLYGRIIEIGPYSNKEFRVKIKHIPDDFENTLIPDNYEEARVQAVYNKSGDVKEIELTDLKPGDEVEIIAELDFITALEKFKQITVFYDE